MYMGLDEVIYSTTITVEIYQWMVYFLYAFGAYMFLGAILTFLLIVYPTYKQGVLIDNKFKLIPPLLLGSILFPLWYVEYKRDKRVIP